jgi:hypothetical protein
VVAGAGAALVPEAARARGILQVQQRRTLGAVPGRLSAERVDGTGQDHNEHKNH